MKLRRVAAHYNTSRLVAVLPALMTNERRAPKMSLSRLLKSHIPHYAASPDFRASLLLLLLLDDGLDFTTGLRARAPDNKGTTTSGNFYDFSSLMLPRYTDYLPSSSPTLYSRLFFYSLNFLTSNLLCLLEKFH